MDCPRSGRADHRNAIGNISSVCGGSDKWREQALLGRNAADARRTGVVETLHGQVRSRVRGGPRTSRPWTPMAPHINRAMREIRGADLLTMLPAVAGEPPSPRWRRVRGGSCGPARRRVFVPLRPSVHLDRACNETARVVAIAVEGLRSLRTVRRSSARSWPCSSVAVGLLADRTRFGTICVVLSSPEHGQRWLVQLRRGRNAISIGRGGLVNDELVAFLRARLDERERIWTERGRAATIAGDSTAVWEAFWHARDIESKRRIITTAENARRTRGGSSTLNGFNIATATVLIDLARVDMYHPDFSDRWLTPSELPARDAADRADHHDERKPDLGGAFSHRSRRTAIHAGAEKLHAGSERRP